MLHRAAAAHKVGRDRCLAMTRREGAGPHSKRNAATSSATHSNGESKSAPAARRLHFQVREEVRGGQQHPAFTTGSGMDRAGT